MKMKKILMALGAIALWSQTSMGHGSEEGRIALEPDLTSMTAGNSQYKFQLINTETNQLIGDQDLNVANEKKLHLIIYDPSLNEFQHVHPEFDGKMWSVDTQFAVNGKYWVWAQGELSADGEEFSAPTNLDITGSTTTWPTPPVLGDQRTGSSGITAIELGKNKVTAGKMAMLDLKMTRTDGSAPQLAPYLGAFAHIIATPADGDSLIHVHASATGTNQGMVHTTFPVAGEYRLWVQFVDGGNLKTIPLSLKVF
jgi:hypothetical protein